MLVKNMVLIIFTFAVMIILSLITKSTIVAGGVTIVTVVAGYIIISYTRHNKRLNLLEEYCDPIAFLEATEKQMSITGIKPKYNTYLNIDKAVGLILAGEFKKAKKTLLLIDKSYLSVENGTMLIYTINLISCLFALKETSAGEEMFEKQIATLPPANKTMVQAVKLLAAHRFFILGRYDESKEQFEELLKEKISKRVKLDILYGLAQIDEKTGDIASAQNKYKEVADNGNKLWIALEAKKRLEQV